MATVNFVHYARQSRAALGRVAEYICRKDKTDDRRFISGQNCAPLFAAQEFAATRALHGKDSPVWFYHYTQSFSPKTDISPKQVHEIAKEFAAQAWPGCEVLIATHVDAKHKHSHFLVNAVCQDTGMMLRQGPQTLKRLRKTSDEICHRHGLPVLGQRPKQGGGMNAREFRSAEKGESWKFRLMFVIDDCMRRARSRKEYEEELRRRGYEVRWTAERKNITYTTPEGMKCRDIRLHEEKYLKEEMEREFRIREELFFGRSERTEPAADAVGTPQRTGMAGSVGRGGEDHIVGSGSMAEDPSCTGTDEQPAAGFTGGHKRTSDTGTGGGTDQGFAAAQSDAPTGWEESREELIGAVYSWGDVGAHEKTVTGGSDRSGDLSSVVGAAVGLIHRLEDLQDAPPVKDATTRRKRTSHKRRRKEQQKKKALGHKDDDAGDWDLELQM